MPGLPLFDPPGSQVLPVLRAPATGLQTMHKMRQKSYTQREVLFPVWSICGRKAKTQGLFKMPQREFNRIHLLQSVWRIALSADPFHVQDFYDNMVF